MKITKNKLKQLIKEVLDERVRDEGETMNKIRAWSKARWAGIDDWNIKWDKLRDAAGQMERFDQAGPIMSRLLSLWQHYWWDTYQRDVGEDDYLFRKMKMANDYVMKNIPVAVRNRDPKEIDKVLQGAVKMSPTLFPSQLR